MIESDNTPARFYGCRLFFYLYQNLFEMMQCLQTVVGIDNSDCACITNGLSDAEKDAIKLSTSGLYVSNLPGGVSLQALDYVEDADCAGLAKIALRERDNAITTFEADLILALNSQYKKSKPNFVGDIGRRSFTQSLSVNGLWQGIRLRPNEYGDGIVTLNRITLVVNVSATFNLYLYRGYAGGATADLIATIPITTTANNYSSVDTNALKLPLTMNGQSLDYFLLYSRSEASAAIPKNNEFDCSTCGGIKASSFLELRGVQFNDLSDFTQTAADNYAHGFILDVGIKCDNEQLFCREYKADDAVALTMAYAVWYKAGELLIEGVLKDQNVNRYTTMAREYLWGKRNHFRSEYESRVNYLAASINVMDSNCYICATESNVPFYSGIYS